MSTAGVTLLIALAIFFFKWRQSGPPKTVPSCKKVLSIRCRGGRLLSEKNGMDKPLIPAQAGTDSWNWDYQSTFALPIRQQPRTLHESIISFFRNPLTLNPPTAPGSTSRFSIRKSLWPTPFHASTSFSDVGAPAEWGNESSSSAGPARLQSYHIDSVSSPKLSSTGPTGTSQMRVNFFKPWDSPPLPQVPLPALQRKSGRSVDSIGSDQSYSLFV